ncbi:hypothetical protein GGF32_003366 [Allomyces javanicus]|nr:hypothetical protein GGF32_003366 [Allomyces javanicus]
MHATPPHDGVPPPPPAGHHRRHAPLYASSPASGVPTNSSATVPADCTPASAIVAHLGATPTTPTLAAPAHAARAHPAVATPTERPLFAAAVGNVRLFAPLLRAAHVQPWATLIASHRGLKVAAGDANLVAAAYVPRAVFREFTWRGDRRAAGPRTPPSRQMLSSVDLDEDDPGVDEDDEPCAVTVDMATLIDCLNLYQSALVSVPAGVVAGSVPLEAMAAASSAFASSAFAHRSVGAALPPQGPAGGAGGAVPPVHSGPSATSARLACQSPTHPLELILTDTAAHLTTTFRLATFDAPDESITDTAHFAADPVLYQLIVHAEWLRDALAELALALSGKPSTSALAPDIDPPPPNTTTTTAPPPGSTAFVVLVVHPLHGLTLHAVTDVGTAEVTCARDAPSMAAFPAPSLLPPTGIKFAYPWPSLAAIARAAPLAAKCAVRANARGFLNVQAMVPVMHARGDMQEVVAFVEFVAAPLEEYAWRGATAAAETTARGGGGGGGGGGRTGTGVGAAPAGWGDGGDGFDEDEDAF